MGSLKIVPFDNVSKKLFTDFLNKDRVLHFWTIYGLQDLSSMRDKVRVWLALENDEIQGYLGEFDRRIVHTHGTNESILKLLEQIDLDEYEFVTEYHHLTVVGNFFQPVKPSDPSSKDKITIFIVMKANIETFKPIVKHTVKKLGSDDLDDVYENLGKEYGERVENTIQKGMAFGAYEQGKLVSVATAPEIIEDLVNIRGVYTEPSFRGRGLSTSTCSALVTEIIGIGKEALIWVADTNIPARKVYKKIGFKETGHILLGFKAKRCK